MLKPPPVSWQSSRKSLATPLERCSSAARLLLAYTWALLVREHSRFLSAVLAVALSAVLINLEWGLMLGIFSTTSIPIDHASADIWVGAPVVPSVDLGRPISVLHRSRLANQPEISETAFYVLAFGQWIRPDSSRETCVIVGTELFDPLPGTVR